MQQATGSFTIKRRNMVRCVDITTANRMIKLIDSVRKEGDTIGGKISCIVKNCPIGLGEPVLINYMQNWAKRC